MLDAVGLRRLTVVWSDTPEDVTRARVVWGRMSALQRAIWRELVARSPEVVNGVELALTLGLTTPERVHSDPFPANRDVIGVVLAATWHFHYVGRQLPLRACQHPPGMYVDAGSAAPWRRALSSAE